MRGRACINRLFTPCPASCCSPWERRSTLRGETVVCGSTGFLSQDGRNAKRHPWPERPRQQPNPRPPPSPADSQEALLDRALSLHQQGQLAEAETLYRTVLDQDGRNPTALKYLGAVLMQLGRPQEARPLLLIAAGHDKNDPEIFDFLGNALAQADEKQKALESFCRALSLNPTFTSAWNNLGMMHKRFNEAPQAEFCFQRALSINPKMTEALNNYGNLLRDLRRFDEAEKKYNQLLDVDPYNANGWFGLASLRKSQRRYAEAAELYLKTVKYRKNFQDAWLGLSSAYFFQGRLLDCKYAIEQALIINANNSDALDKMGTVLIQLRDYQEAEKFYKASLALDPNNASVLNNMAGLLFKSRRYREAFDTYSRCVSLHPENAMAWMNMGELARRANRPNQAMEYYKKSLEYRPDYPEAISNIGMIDIQFSDLDMAESRFRRAIEIAPDMILVRDNLLFALNYKASITAEELFREYQIYNDIVEAKTEKRFTHEAHPRPEGRRLRIGYSSPDLRAHACLFFIEALFRCHNHDRVETFAYANVSEPDVHTDRVKAYFDHWIDVVPMNDEAMAQRIHDDQIDVLVDLAGHTGGNRLPVFVMRPAPIQVSYLGYGYTTGLTSIDYYLGDENLTPPGSEPYFSESLWHLPPPMYCYELDESKTIPVNDLPALTKGYVTFGTLSRTIRLNDGVLLTWKRILDRVPNSRLRLDQKPFVEEATREKFWERLETLGIPRERVELCCTRPHWAAYHDIDITLDCWPHNAGTTTLESLWMGVPVLSKTDRPSVGRVGASLLCPLDLGEWVVDSIDEYVDKAVAYANSLPLLAELRHQLRDRVKTSAMMDPEDFVSRIENAYEQMVTTWWAGR
ncbi:tetratricopeptide repeat protein [Pararhodospirillum photometricum]|uniref:protein O-GlcNAc transferase n=1 Tax=Pararhodospirillum photometricum DSM 122 TaxID=1150469 RepID=H6SSC6_PARPM|nr:tetratricopeptide repeat protein [Pararhodospirillum photometricum]CCG07805.1 Putative uncharacterized protein [Pararhodospirillum photometricum DSM 122]